MLERIAASRHGALYATFGSDPYVFEALVNGDAHTTYGIGKQAELFVSFAEALLREVAGGTLDIIGELRDRKARTWLFLCTYVPWFDSPKYEQLQNAELADIIECINRWLTECARY